MAFPIHEKYGGEAECFERPQARGVCVYDGVESGFGSQREAVGIASSSKPFLQVQPVPDTEEVAGEE